MAEAESVKGSLYPNELRRIKEEGSNELFNNLPLFASDFNVDADRASTINFSKRIGSGRQGIVYALFDADDKVVKVLKLKKPNEVTDNEIMIATFSVYASNIGVGPVVYGPPFITPDGKYVAIIMDRVTMYSTTEADVDEMIALFENMINNKFMTFDMEYGKKNNGQLVIVDFGVSGFFNSVYDALKSAVIDNDIFVDTGMGNYYRRIEEHFRNLITTMQAEATTGAIGTAGGKKKRTKKRTMKHRKNVKKGRKHKKTYRNKKWNKNLNKKN
jgi:hypothetical protein